MKFLKFKAGAVTALILLALVMSCADEERVTPRSSLSETSSIENENDEIIVYEDPDFIAESDDTKNARIDQMIKVRYITGYFARLSNATAGSVKLKIVKESSNTTVAQSGSLAVSSLKVWNGNVSNVDYKVCTFGWTNGINLDPNESYRIEAHCTDCSTDADKKVVWWSTNDYTSSSQDSYTLGTGKSKTGASWVSNNNDFSFKIQNVNSDGSFYVSRAQSTKQKVYAINTSTIQAQSFKPELGDDYIISIPDANLAAKVREKAGLAVGASITYGSVKNITSLPSIPSTVLSLEGIQYLENLVELAAQGAVIADLTPLQGLTNLQTLYLNTSATDLTVLQGLTNLQGLSVVTPTTSLAPLSSLTNLTYLRLQVSAITNIDALRTLSNLNSLYISGDNVNNIDALTELTNLTNLYVRSNGMTDFSTVETLSQLRSLTLHSNSFTKVPRLDALTDLYRAGFTGRALEDISALSTPLPALTNLEIVSSKVDNLEAIRNQTQITELRILGISKVSAISNLVNVRFLHASNCGITDVSPFSDLANLEYLDLSFNQIQSVEALDNLTNLRHLLLVANPLTQEEVDALQEQLPNTNVMF